MAKKQPKPLSHFGGRTDLITPTGYRAAVQHVVAVHEATPPEIRRNARDWYPRVHDAVAKSARQAGLSARQGAAITAVVSPQMDWEGSNIHALGDLAKVTDREWATIHGSAAAGGKRTEAASRVVQGRSFGGATDKALIKAHRIMQDESSIDELLSFRDSSPKTSRFYEAIIDPDAASHNVVVDGRAHDIARNSLLPWGTSRGIDQGEYKRPGRKTQYQLHEDVYRDASDAVSRIGRRGSALNPQQMQAVTWEGGKHIERSMVKGGKGKQGPPRQGQPYVR